MEIEYQYDEKGVKKTVLVPVKEWDKLNKERNQLKKRLEALSLARRFKKVLRDVESFKRGTLKTTPAKDFLNEL